MTKSIKSETKIVECNEIYMPNIINNEYESSDIASKEELSSISHNINANHARYIYPFISYEINCGHHYHWHNTLRNNAEIIADNMGIKYE